MFDQKYNTQYDTDSTNGHVSYTEERILPAKPSGSRDDNGFGSLETRDIKVFTIMRGRLWKVRDLLYSIFSS